MKIVDLKGQVKETSCLSCAIQNGELKTPGGSIVKTKYFDAHQDFEIPIPGFVILVSHRHLKSVDDFTQAEQQDFIQLLTALRKAMRKVLDIQVVYLIQEEDTSHHFHIWLFPRYEWMGAKFGYKIQSVRPIMEYARTHMKTSENLNKVHLALKQMQSEFNRSELNS